MNTHAPVGYSNAKKLPLPQLCARASHSLILSCLPSEFKQQNKGEKGKCFDHYEAKTEFLLSDRRGEFLGSSKKAIHPPPKKVKVNAENRPGT